jgi:hypothetical protein
LLHHKCLRELSVETVYRAVGELLDATRQLRAA